MALRIIKQIVDEKMEVYYERILKLANCLNHKVDVSLFMTFFQVRLVPYLRVTITRVKRDTLFFHKNVTMTCKTNMGDVNEYWKLLEPPPKLETTRDSKKGDSICGQ
jgi:hypothetical protein